MNAPYTSDKRIPYHLDGTTAFYRVYSQTAENKILPEYYEISPTQMEFMNRSDGSAFASFPIAAGNTREITFFFPDMRTISSFFASVVVPLFGNISSGVTSGASYEIWTSSDTTGLDDGTWTMVGVYSFSDDPLASYRQQVNDLIGEGILSIKALRIRAVVTAFADVFELSKARIHMYGRSTEDSPLGGLHLVKSDGSLLTVQDLYVGSKRMRFDTDQSYEEITFKVRNTTNKTASSLSVNFEYVLPHTGTHLHDPVKLVRVGSGSWVESSAQVGYTASLPDLPPGTDSEEISFKLFLKKITEFTVPQWGVLSPIIIRPTVGAWV